MAYFVLMCYGHSISSPSLTLPTNTTVVATKSLAYSYNNNNNNNNTSICKAHNVSIRAESEAYIYFPCPNSYMSNIEAYPRRALSRYEGLDAPTCKRRTFLMHECSLGQMPFLT